MTGNDHSSFIMPHFVDLPQKIWCIENFCVFLQENKYLKQIVMEPKLGDMMKVNPSLTGSTDWIEGQVIDVEHNPFMGLVISIKDNLGRIFFGQSKYFEMA